MAINKGLKLVQEGRTIRRRSWGRGQLPYRENTENRIEEQTTKKQEQINKFTKKP